MSGNELRDRVRDAMRTGELPRRAPERTWAGPGCGARCVICGEHVGPDQVEFELEFTTGQGGDAPGDYHVHRGCFLVWEF